MIAAPISRVLAFAVLFAIGAAGSPAHAQLTSWTDATGSWFIPGNWSFGVPTGATAQTLVVNGGTAQISGAAANAGTTLIIAGMAAGSTVDLQAGGSLTAGTIRIAPNGTLLLSGSTNVAASVLSLQGGTLRSTTTGTLDNFLIFAPATTSTIAAAAGQTLTFQGPFAWTVNASAALRIGSATDTGTVVFGTLSNVLLPGTQTYEVVGGTWAEGSSGGISSLTSQGASTTVDAGATLDLSQFTSRVNTLLGAGQVVTGVSAATVLELTGNGNFSGTITGAGQVSVLNGTTLLTGTNTYSGGTAIAAGATLTLAGSGSIVGSVANSGILNFTNSSTAGTTTITNNSTGTLEFLNTSTAGNATIINNGALPLAGMGFFNSSTAGNANITNNGPLGFNDTSTAGDATITNTFILNFRQTSTAGNAKITNQLNNINFFNSSTAGNATITNSGSVDFFDTSTAGNATINIVDGQVSFRNTSTAGNATITNNKTLAFFDTSTAGNATIINNAIIFGTSFSGNSTGGNATITNNGFLQFRETSTAGDATITTNASMFGTSFVDHSTGGNARFIANAGSTVDFSKTLGPAGDKKVSAGSIEGAGMYFLGSNQLTVGSNNLNTTLSGVISDCGPSGTNCINSGATGGSLVKVGTGTLTLTGTNTYTGATTVNAGTLFVNGSIANSAVTVNSGAMLAGIGTVGATTINSGGIFAPGSSPGTMTVQGNLAFQSGAIYLVQVNPSTASSTNVTAGGSATLAGTVQAAFASGSYAARTYTILSAAGGLNGTTFNTLTTSNLPAGFTASLSYTATDAILNLTATLGQPGAPGGPSAPPSGPGAVGTGGLSFNQFNVANSLNNFFNNGGALPPSFVGIFGLTGANLASGLSQLSGEAATGAQKVGFQLTDQFLNLMLDPFVDGRSGVGGADHPALGFAPAREDLPEDIALAYAKILKAPPKPVPVYEPRWTVWGAGFGGSNRTDGDLAVVGSHDLSARTAGGAAGLDYRLTPNTVVGLALAGAGTDWSLSQGLGGGKSDAFQAGLYGATKSGPAYLAAAFAFANHWMSTDRFAVGDHLTANFNAQSYGGRLEGGYRFATPYAGITPYAAIQAQNFHTPGYTETGLIPTGFALAFGSRDATDTRSELGARFDRLLAVYTNAVLALRGRVAWAHDWVSDATLAPVFQTLPGASFIVNGALPVKDSALVSAGGELRIANGVTLLAKFDGEFASHSSTYAGTGTLRYRW
jgi:autotransporter-associated beta strand protein